MTSALRMCDEMSRPGAYSRLGKLLMPQLFEIISVFDSPVYTH